MKNILDEEFESEVLEKISEKQDEYEKLIREKPVEAVAVAFVAGILLGKLLK